MAPTSRGGHKVSFGGRLRRYHQFSKQGGGRHWECDKSSAAYKFPGFAATDTKETGSMVLNRGPNAVECDPSSSGIHADGVREEIIGARLHGGRNHPR